jgi:hypothetical protein
MNTGKIHRCKKSKNSRRRGGGEIIFMSGEDKFKTWYYLEIFTQFFIKSEILNIIA